MAEHSELPDARILADYILLESFRLGCYLTPLQVNKLCYLTHGFSMRAGRAGAFYNDVEAWPFGPVIREVYDAFRRYGRSDIRKLHGTMEPVCGAREDTKTRLANSLGEDITKTADSVVAHYARVDGGMLIEMTHAKDTPWSKTRSWWPFNTPRISTETIKTFYEKLEPSVFGR